MHHLLSHHRILEKGESLFPDGNNPALAAVLRKVVPWVCAYHRGFTKLLKKQGKPDLSNKSLLEKTGNFLYGEDFDRFLSPLEERLELEKTLEGLPEGYEIEPETVLRVTALLRVLDGCDAQADRTVDPVYLEARLERTAEEARFLYECLKPLEKWLDFEMKGPRALDQGEGLGLKEDSFLSELNRYLDFAGRLDPESASTGDVDPDLKKFIENQCRRLYENIFDRLIFLVKESGRESFVSKAQELQALSLANRIVFKWEQFLHFYKHLCIDFVIPVREGNQIQILVWPNETSGIKKEVINVMLGDVEKDINREFESVKDVLEGIQIQAKCR